MNRTIGVDFKVNYLQQNGQKIKVRIWDSAGQCRYRSVISTYFRGSHGIVLVYDLAERPSFLNLITWLHEIKKNAPENCPVILVSVAFSFLVQKKKKVAYMKLQP